MNAFTVAAPLIVRLPPNRRQREGGRVVNEPVSGVDLVPTFYAQAGLTPPWEMHGRDLSPVLSGDKRSWNYPAMLVHTAKQYGSKTAVIPPKGDPTAT